MLGIIPSILAKTPEEFEQLVKKIEPHFQRAHIDIADGEFVPNKTICGYKEIMNLSTNLELDVHLMVNQPIKDIHEWLKTKASRIIAHVETNHVLKETSEIIKINNRQFGLAINPDSRTESLVEYLSDIDFVLFMTVVPGFYGSPLVEGVLGKIAAFHEEFPEVPIMVDGAMNPENVTRAMMAGATEFVVGSYIVSSDDMRKSIDSFNK